MRGCSRIQVVNDAFRLTPFAEMVLAGQGLDRLTTHERAVLEAYAGNGFERINQALRRQVSMTPELDQRIRTIRSALLKYPLPVRVRVTRETEAALYGLVDESSAQLIMNEVFEESGFLSTCVGPVPPRSRRHSQPVILDLIVPAGTPALRLADLSDVSDEREVLIIDARDYYVVDVEFDQQRKMWHVYAVILEGEA